mmetsp:Transcript_44601/g.95863  ORF Transcript_44601/g.95863 Transcript_44601/m.95863 type:complete len:108 (-) Transcript_44601:1374-1697(-)
MTDTRVAKTIVVMVGRWQRLQVLTCSRRTPFWIFGRLPCPSGASRRIQSMLHMTSFVVIMVAPARAAAAVVVAVVGKWELWELLAVAAAPAVLVAATVAWEEELLAA